MTQPSVPVVLPDTAKCAAVQGCESRYIGEWGNVMRGRIQLLGLLNPETKQPSDEAKSEVTAADGELFVDGGFVGTTEAALRLAPGKHMVKISSGSVNDSPQITIISPVALNLEVTLDSIRLGLNEPRIDPGQTDWPHKRLLPRYLGPISAELYYGLSDFAEEVLVRDFNERGLYFWSSRSMPIGGNVDIRMNRGRSVRYRATVLRVEEASEGKFGTAALIKGCRPS